MTDRGEVRIGVSACLLGERVRWDGAHKLDAYLRDTVGRFVTFVPVCPEVEAGFGVPVWLTGIVLTLLTGFVLLGGIKRIGAVAEKLVPFMCIAYIVVALLVLFLNLGEIPAALGLILSHAFSPVAATGFWREYGRRAIEPTLTNPASSGS